MNSEEQLALTAVVSRRGFLNASASATLAALGGASPRTLWAGTDRPKATADTLIVLWMAGGMAQTETFDPKRPAEFEPGMKANDVLSTFRPIDTAVDHIKFSQGLERIARVMDRGTLIRSYQAADLGFILHSRHQYHWHTGYAPPQTVAMPHIGAVIAKTLGPKNPDVPAFIDIGQNMESGESAGLKAFHSAGFLGTDYGPFLVSNPLDAGSSVRPLPELGDARFAKRHELLQKLAAESPIARYGGEYQRESLCRSVEAAHRLLNSPSAKAFDLSLEPKQSY